MNEKYTQALLDFTQHAHPEKYLIVGSVALLSYTKPHGYNREIHDIDIIMEITEALKVADHLKQFGYLQTTFINPRMPFYSRLMKFSESKYLRFSKDGVDIEILATSIEDKSNLVLFEIYPGIKAGLPKNAFTVSTYSNVRFSTVSEEMLYIFKKFANNTIGRKVKYKAQQRYDDLSHLQELIDSDKLNVLAKLVRLYVLGLPLKVPQFLMR